MRLIQLLFAILFLSKSRTAIIVPPTIWSIKVNPLGIRNLLRQYSKLFKLKRYILPKYKFHYKNKKSYLYIKGNDKINELFLVYRIEKDESEKKNEFYSITLIRIR